MAGLRPTCKELTSNDGVPGSIMETLRENIRAEMMEGVWAAFAISRKES
jgi:hypothetical protein